MDKTGLDGHNALTAAITFYTGILREDATNEEQLKKQLAKVSLEASGYVATIAELEKRNAAEMAKKQTLLDDTLQVLESHRGTVRRRDEDARRLLRELGGLLAKADRHLDALALAPGVKTEAGEALDEAGQVVSRLLQLHD